MKSSPFPIPATPLLLTGAGLMGVLCLLGFVVQTLHAKWDFNGDFNHLYVAATAWRHGFIPYGVVTPAFSIPDGPTSAYLQWYYYPPLCTALIAPLSELAYPTAVFVWKCLMAVLLIGALWAFLCQAAPQWPVSLRLGLLGVTALSGSVHWVMHFLQPTGIIVALLLLFACAAMQNRWAAAVVLAVLISLKPIFWGPVLCLFLFRRRLDLLGLSVVLILALNLLATYPQGPQKTTTAYVHQLSIFFLPDTIYDEKAAQLAAPGFVTSDAGKSNGNMYQLLQMDYLLSAWTDNRAVSKTVALIFKLSVIVWFVRLWKRVAGTPMAENPQFQTLLFGAAMTFSLLAVYHQHYDAIAVFPALIGALQRLQSHPRDGAAWVVVVSAAILAYLLRQVLLSAWMTSVVSPSGLGAMVPLCSYLTLFVFGGTLVLLWRSAGQSLVRTRPENTRPLSVSPS